MLSLENAWRALKSGDGRISLATQITLLCFLLTLTLTSGAIQRYLADNLDQMLGSDMVVESHGPLTPDHDRALRSLASRSSVTQLSDVTLTRGEQWAKGLASAPCCCCSHSCSCGTSAPPWRAMAVSRMAIS